MSRRARSVTSTVDGYRSLVTAIPLHSGPPVPASRDFRAGSVSRSRHCGGVNGATWPRAHLGRTRSVSRSRRCVSEQTRRIGRGGADPDCQRHSGRCRSRTAGRPVCGHAPPWAELPATPARPDVLAADFRVRVRSPAGAESPTAVGPHSGPRSPHIRYAGGRTRTRARTHPASPMTSADPPPRTRARRRTPAEAAAFPPFRPFSDGPAHLYGRRPFRNLAPAGGRNSCSPCGAALRAGAAGTAGARCARGRATGPNRAAAAPCRTLPRPRQWPDHAPTTARGPADSPPEFPPGPPTRCPAILPRLPCGVPYETGTAGPYRPGGHGHCQWSVSDSGA
ncbi:hypothetical protein SAMN05216259_11038 [Actinacidiphila guanduensis]|uniref:Uncharacterized protein n=1 Tax=Actinacidiphila guanduensis TaxID=310781 RepID=A0A1H0JYE7_9ACTN|nr:hypothetical protein SAMN05216259_11038 [Actinacidiphila guanduensis]